MSADVVSLKGGPVTSQRREEFVQAVAASFDLYVESLGAEPDAIVYVMGGIKQTSRISWHMSGETEGGATTMLCVAAAHCQAHVSNGLKEL